MTETEWLGSPHLYTMIRFLEAKASGRRLLLFGCACCRRVWDLLQLDAGRRIVELAEDHADGKVGQTDLWSAADSPDFVCLEPQFARQAGPAIQLSACMVDALQAVRCLAASPLDLGLIAQNTSRDKSRDFFLSTQHNYGIGISVRRDQAEFAAKVKLLPDIFGNPFRPVTFNPAWRTDQTVGIAAKMYEERDFAAMPILADALQDAGCDHPDILAHCRGDDPHVRGCWVVDLVLGKE